MIGSKELKLILTLKFQMKLLLVLCALLGLSAATLRDDFNEIEALIPVEQIKEIYHQYKNDADIAKVVAYLKSEDFTKVLHIVFNVDEVKGMISWLESKDIHVIEELNKIADLLGQPHYPGSYVVKFSHETRTWRQFIDAVLAVIPKDKLLAVVMDKMMNSEDFQEMYSKIAEVDYQKLHDNALKHPEIVDMITRLNAMGVDTKKIWEAIKGIFGWEYFSRRQSRSLRDDMDELLALIPKEKIVQIYMKYREDPDIKKVVAYLKSSDFAAVAHIVAGVPEVQEMVTYLEGKGLKVVETLNKIADLLGLPHWPGSLVHSWPRQARTWRQFIDEVLAVLPMKDIEALLVDKLMNSADFQELYQKISDLDYNKLHDNALKHPEIVDMLKRLNAMGVDTKKIWQAIKDLFGWE